MVTGGAIIQGIGTRPAIPPSRLIVYLSPDMRALVQPGAHLAAKIPGLFSGCRRHGLAGFVWFDITQHDGGHHQNYRLGDEPAALAMYRHEARIYRW